MSPFNLLSCCFRGSQADSATPTVTIKLSRKSATRRGAASTPPSNAASRPAAFFPQRSFDAATKALISGTLLQTRGMVKDDLPKVRHSLDILPTVNEYAADHLPLRARRVTAAGHHDDWTQAISLRRLASCTSGCGEARQSESQIAQLLLSSGSHSRQGLNKLDPPLNLQPATDLHILQNNIHSVLQATNSGLLPEHLSALVSLATERGLAIGFRPVSPWASSLLRLGYPTKPFAIKYKSEKQGIAAGHLLARGPDGERRAVDPITCALPLLLTGERVRELLDKKTVQRTHEQETQAAMRSTMTLVDTEIPTDRPVWHYQLRPMPIDDPGDYLQALNSIHRGNTWGVWVSTGEADEPNWERLEVLGQAQCGLPLTADYDLLTVAPPHCAQSPEDSAASNLVPPLSMESLNDLLRARVTLRKIVNHEIDGASPEDPTLGNASALLKALVPEINRALNCQPGREVVHHNWDAHNPYSREKDIYPAIFCLPQKPGFENTGVAAARNEREFTALSTWLGEQGYGMVLNPGWIGGRPIPQTTPMDQIR